MGYMHIINLYDPKGQNILLFKEVWALEKIHGSSAAITWSFDKGLHFFSGGTKHETFLKIFDQESLTKGFTNMGIVDRETTVYGESYAGKEQGMSHTYGIIPRFVAFDVKLGDCWLDVPKAEKVVKDLGLEFVYYTKVSTDLKSLDAERDAPSIQAVRNGISVIVDGIITNPKIKEGIVIKPLIELTKNNGQRIMAKHKRLEFSETKTPRSVIDPEKNKMIEDANKVADEYVTVMRLQHVLDKIPNHSIQIMKTIIDAMIEDVNREGGHEFVDSPAVRKSISTKTALTYKEYLK